MDTTNIPHIVEERATVLIESHDPDTEARARELATKTADETVAELTMSEQLAVFEQYRMTDETVEMDMGTVTRDEAVARLAKHAFAVDMGRRLMP